jgi:hypothetical protein
MPRTTNKQFNKNNSITSISSNRSIASNKQPVIIKNNSSLYSSIKEGFGFGIGSTIARNMFGGSTVSRDTDTHVLPSNTSLPVQPLTISKVSCVEYNKCLESDDKYECFGNLDQREYVECRTKK